MTRRFAMLWPAGLVSVHVFGSSIHQIKVKSGSLLPGAFAGKKKARLQPKKRLVMELTFTRSGGFAAAATSVEGKLLIDGEKARVTSDSGYQRDLDAAELRTVRTALAQSQAASDAPAPPGQTRDAYQYDVQLKEDGGAARTLTTHGEQSSGSQQLFDWVRKECDRIWAKKISR